MKLVHSDIQNVIQIQEGIVNSLIIENAAFMYEILRDLKVQIEGYDGDWVLSENDKPLSIPKHVDLTVDFITFDVNRKTLITKIISALDKTARSDEYIERSSVLLSKIEKYMYDLCEGYDVSITCEKITIQQILKAVGIKVEVDGDRLIEVLYSYMQLVREFEGEKLFVFVNLRSFVSDDDFMLFSDTANKHRFNVLYIENNAHDLLKDENRLIVDNDLCEI